MNSKREGAFIKALRKIEDKGFYIILSLCVIAIGVSGYVLFVNKETQIALEGEANTIWTFDEDNLGIKEPEEDVYRPVPPDVTVDPGDKVNENNEDRDNTDNSPEDKGEDQSVAEIAKAVLPTGGSIIRGFSGSELVYDNTMSDWRTHNGTDFACTQGDTVFCVRDGVVADVFEDGLFGWSVKIEHSDGIESTYSGLSPVSGVKVGDRIKMGEAVGTAGGTAIAESSEPYHVHVTVTENGQYIDIVSLFN